MAFHRVDHVDHELYGERPHGNFVNIVKDNERRVYMPNEGTQPIRSIMHHQRWSIARLAVETGVTYSHLRAVVYGYVRPCDHLRQVLPDILGVKITALFMPEMLCAPYAEHMVGPTRSSAHEINV